MTGTGGGAVFERAVAVLGRDVAEQVRATAARRLTERPLSAAQVDLLAGLMSRTPSVDARPRPAAA